MALRTDVAVIGLGAMGAATLYQLARRGIAAIGIDRFEPPHSMGSSHGETRITRAAVGEGDAYVPFALRSHAIWRELEAATGEDLLNQCGFIAMGRSADRILHHGTSDFVQNSAAIAARRGIPHDVLDAAGVGARFPSFILRGDESAYLEPGGGFVYPERCVAAQLRRATELGATAIIGCQVTAIERAGNTTSVQLGSETIIADRVVVAAGAWAGKLLGGPFTRTLLPYRQALHWYPVDDPDVYLPGNFPTFIWLHSAKPDGFFYGFPGLPGAGCIKLAMEQYDATCDPDTVTRDVTEAESARVFASHVAGRLQGVRPAAVRTSSCFYTVTADAGFVIDEVPDMPGTMVVSACSGHGFKHSAGVGETVAQLVVEGRSDIDIGPFRLDRLFL